MFGLEALDLARIQFAFTISFHIVFPAITIGLASFLAVLEGLWLRTKNEVYRDLYHFWSKIFALNFGMGVVSGLVMAYQFGTNWAGFSNYAGSVTGPLLAYEVLTAFFLEAGFLGVMLFGWNRVGPKLHFFSTAMVAIGTIISTFWILASNSWMQTPQGFEVISGRVVPVDWLAVVFNPSFPYRLVHMATAAFLASALFVAASAAWHLLRGRDNPAFRTMLSMAMWIVMIVAPLQIIVGDAHGLNTLKYQPAKIAAIEGHWDNSDGKPTPLILFGCPNMKEEKTGCKLEIPYLGSLILTHTLSEQVPALKEFAPADRPNSSIIFWSFRAMVTLGMLMALTGALSGLLRWRGTLYKSRYFLHLCLWMGPSGVLAILAGWITTEVGRQPWVVYGFMRTAHATSNQPASQVGVTLALFVIVYFAVFGAGISYMMRLVRKGPVLGEGATKDGGGPGTQRTPSRPLSAALETSAIDSDVAIDSEGARHGY
jgi:cytochrome d ubiquinol oxidase subunit I